jgi:hypothetical protein
LVYFLPKTFILFVFPIFWLWATWWKLFHKHVVHTKLDIYIFIIQIITNTCSYLCTRNSIGGVMFSVVEC